MLANVKSVPPVSGPRAFGSAVGNERQRNGVAFSAGSLVSEKEPLWFVG